MEATLQELIEWLSSAALERLVQLFALVTARVAPIVSLSPAFGGEALGQRLRVALIVALAAVFGLSLEPGFELHDELTLVGLLAKEALVGGSIALLVRLSFDLVAATGALVDQARGATLASVLDPLSRQQSSVLAQFLVLAFSALYFSIGGHAWVLEALARSFAAYPLNELSPAGLWDDDALLGWIALGSELVLAAVMLAAPAIAVVFLLDAALGLAQRLAPSLQVFFLGGTVKGLIGVGVLLLVASTLFETLLARAASLLATFAR